MTGGPSDPLFAIYVEMYNCSFPRGFSSSIVDIVGPRPVGRMHGRSILKNSFHSCESQRNQHKNGGVTKGPQWRLHYPQLEVHHSETSLNHYGTFLGMALERNKFEPARNKNRNILEPRDGHTQQKNPPMTNTHRELRSDPSHPSVCPQTLDIQKET